MGGTPHVRDASGALPRTGADRPGGAPGAAGGAASGQDLLAFRHLYDSPGEGEKGAPEGGGSPAGGEGAPARPEPLPFPAYPAFPLPWAGQAWAGPSAPDPASAGGQGAASEVSLPELASELVGRLLVKEGEGPAAGQEIRILLRHCALEGTEVRFRRGGEGGEGLHLVFVPDSQAGGDLLRRRSDSLESLLRSRLSSGSVTVTVQDPDDAGRPAAGRRA